MDEHTLNLRPPVWLPITVVVIAGLAFIAGKHVEVRGYQPLQISVDGDGRVSAAPDIAQLSFGIQTGRQKTAQAAMEKLRKDMEAIITAVKAAGIDAKDIRTESLWLNPAYDWVDGRQVPQGFEASQSLRVKVRNLDTIGKVLSDATAAGANQVGDVSFTIDDPEELRTQARNEAIAKAKAKASALAAQLGKSLGKLKAYNEGSFGGPPVPMYEKAMMADGMGGGGGVPVPAGEQEVRLSVVLTYELR
ncbi:MAG: hypothetical protein G01um101425_152 [Candidatus Peregrinibacteria bacterium Gr01-1014_25]|nr:MAG: hypothetical protein G01um101425_152 [Candidatus Peregrinibacteria bacterium Gr01-1014_25]